MGQCALLRNLQTAFSLEAIQIFSGGVLTVFGPNATAGIFATYPAEGIHLGTGFADQVRS